MFSTIYTTRRNGDGKTDVRISEDRTPGRETHEQVHPANNSIDVTDMTVLAIDHHHDSDNMWSLKIAVIEYKKDRAYGRSLGLTKPEVKKLIQFLQVMHGRMIDRPGKHTTRVI